MGAEERKSGMASTPLFQQPLVLGNLHIINTLLVNSWMYNELN